MKKLIAGALMIIIFTAACRKHKTDFYKLELNKTELALNASAGSFDSVLLRSQLVEWRVITNGLVSWVMPDKITGTGSATLKFTTVNENTGTTIRSALFTIVPVNNDYVQPINLTIKQRAL